MNVLEQNRPLGREFAAINYMTKEACCKLCSTMPDCKAWNHFRNKFDNKLFLFGDTEGYCTLYSARQVDSKWVQQRYSETPQPPYDNVATYGRTSGLVKAGQEMLQQFGGGSAQVPICTWCRPQLPISHFHAVQASGYPCPATCTMCQAFPWADPDAKDLFAQVVPIASLCGVSTCIQNEPHVGCRYATSGPTLK